MLTLRSNLIGDSVAHAFFGRQGGVSTGIYSSLNCGPGSNDAPEAVRENRWRALAALSDGGPAALMTLYQVHSATCIAVDRAWTAEVPKADALVTRTPRLALGILTADCAPVLLADKTSGVIGAAHAGWSGAFSGVIESVVAAMERLGAERENISAAIGPCISQSAYEVGPEFEARFRDADQGFTRFFVASDREGHFRFNLEEFVADRLRRAGVPRVEPLRTCTYAAEDTFFSYRRTTHRKETDYGRQLSAIMLA